MAKMLRITLVRSPIGYSIRQKQTARTLGLRKLNQVVERPDNPAVRGMVNKISHLLRVEEVEA
ncbi:MAG TPA: 50S ribosomal protein L30 [Anaerolineae bacterium]|nr:50S ribosomal protein L30 [Anaerolineae bacterium]HQI85383.1 50S ribosomal protein L30 [Anaerolineae bacterium]